MEGLATERLPLAIGSPSFVDRNKIFSQNGRFLNVKLMLMYPFAQLEDGQYRGLLRNLTKSAPSVEIIALNFSRDGHGERWLQRDLYTRLLVDLAALGRRAVLEESSLITNLIHDDCFPKLLVEANKLLNRQDFSGTFRYQEREVEIRFRLRAIFYLLGLVKPGLIVFPITPHLIDDYLLYFVAKRREIPILFFQPVSIIPALLPRSAIDEVFLASHESREKYTLESGFGVRASDLVKRFEQGTPPKYMSRQETSSRLAHKLSGRVRTLSFSLRWLFSPRFPASSDFTGLVGGRLWFNLARQVLLRGLQSGLQGAMRGLSDDWDPGKKYAVFALHYEPERTSFPEGGPFVFQGDIIEVLRTLLPPDVTLYVKEHRSQGSPSLRGFLGRSPLFYSLVDSLPNTRALSADIDTVDLLRNAVCVFTITGTVAIECAARGIPVGYFGNPWWEGMPGSIKISNATSYEEIEAVERANKFNLESFLDELVQAKLIHGIGAEDPRDYEARHGTLPVGFEQRAERSLAETILLEVRKLRKDR